MARPSLMSREGEFQLPVKKCDPVLLSILEQKSLPENDEVWEYRDRLKQKAKEQELLFGEIMLCLAKDVKVKVTDVYFTQIWRASQVMEPFYDLYVWEITDDRIEQLFQEKEASPNQRRFSMHWIRWARKSEFNTHKEEPEYGIHTHPPHGYREKKNRVFVESIHFPENYKLPAYARFRTVFKYWVWRHKDDYSESYILDTMCTAYKRMEPLHDMPFRKVRADDVRHCMTGLTQSCRNAVITLYHAMDMLAYEQDVITRRYSEQLKSVKPAHVLENKFSEDDIRVLRQHAGEIEVDAALVLLYTGMTAQEICRLAMEQIYDGYIHIARDRTPYSARNIPVHPAIADSLSHVVRYMEERDAKEAREQRRRMGVYWMVTKATETYCNEQHSCRDCRASFAARLKEAGANDIVIEYLYGTKESFLKAYKHAYAHPSPDRIKEAVLRLN